MYTIKRPAIGIYEKALPKDTNWKEKLIIAKKTGYDFVEMSIDESDLRLSRLEYKSKERKEIIDSMYETNMRIRSICLSGHRRYSLGSLNDEIRGRGLDIMKKAIELAVDLGIRIIQLSGYDVYYEDSTEQTNERYIEALKAAAEMAASAGVMLGIETMDTDYLNSITKYMKFDRIINSPWLGVYPDLGNLSGCNNDIGSELERGISRIVAIHLKDSHAATSDFPGQFRDVSFGEGCVDFEGVFRVLKGLKYKGAFVIEMWNERAEDPIGEIERARNWILAQMKKAFTYIQ